MKTEDDLIREIRDLFLAWLDTHRTRCPERPACGEPINALAYVGHCLGIRSTKVAELRQRLEEYETTCVGCRHLRN